MSRNRIEPEDCAGGDGGRKGLLRCDPRRDPGAPGIPVAPHPDCKTGLGICCHRHRKRPIGALRRRQAHYRPGREKNLVLRKARQLLKNLLSRATVAEWREGHKEPLAVLILRGLRPEIVKGPPAQHVFRPERMDLLDARNIQLPGNGRVTGGEAREAGQGVNSGLYKVALPQRNDELRPVPGENRLFGAFVGAREGSSQNLFRIVR
jgi:hypothetical protein